MNAVQRADVVTGLVQQAIEELYQLTTYDMSSVALSRHSQAHKDVRKALVEARNRMEDLALALWKEAP